MGVRDDYYLAEERAMLVASAPDRPNPSQEWTTAAAKPVGT